MIPPHAVVLTMETITASDGIGIDQALAGWRDEMTARGIRASSIARMTRTIEAAAAGCAWATAREISYGECVAYLAAKRRSGAWSGASYDQAVSILRGFGKYLRRSGALRANPLEDLLSSREPGGEGSRAYSIEEAARHVAASFRRHSTDRRARGNAPLFWTFCFLTGLRYHEARACAWGDIALEHGFALTDPAWAKSRRKDRIALAPCLIELLRLHRSQIPSGRRDPVWPIAPNRSTWHADREAAGISEIDERGRPATIHSCRKSFATWLDALPGISSGVVSRLARHATTLTEERYIDPSSERERAAVALLPSPWPAGAIPAFRMGR